MEETWPTNGESILFLGEWCRLYGRKGYWENLDAEVAPYHWDDRNKLHDDYGYLDGLYERLLVDLAKKLNQTHGVNHSDRYWRILIGPWLGYFIQMLLDRWFMLKQAIEKNGITVCNIIERDDLAMVPNGMAEFGKLYVSDDWNEAVYAQLLTKIFIPCEVKINEVRERSRRKDGGKQQKAKFALKSHADRWINRINALFTSTDDHFFLASYLPLPTELLLQLRLKQFPKWWRPCSLPDFNPSASQRTWELSHESEEDGDSFEAVAREMISGHIPAAYLEGYEQLIELSRRVPWPKKPKSIFTSNAYLDNDLFKAWAAEKTEAGVPLVIGQHGGHFGMTPFAFHEEHQIRIADKWISWGWSDSKRPHIVPIGNLKSFGRTVKHDPNGGALMVEMAMPRYSYHLYAVPVARQYLDYFSEQKRFLSSLPIPIRRSLVLRLYHHDYGWHQRERWQDQSLDVQLDDGTINIRNLIAKSRIYISTYNATTYLESLTWNVPTIIFWNPEHWELRDEAKPYFEILESAGIFHRTPESAARQMIAVWDDVETWWQSPLVQDARCRFCERFARTPPDYVSLITWMK